nr:MAG TPA: hypothetical protein [Caudoviricetes sp.]
MHLLLKYVIIQVIGGLNLLSRFGITFILPAIAYGYKKAGLVNLLFLYASSKKVQ